MRIVDPYAVSPQDIQPGDVMFFVVKAMVGWDGEGLVFRAYRCRHELSDWHDRQVAEHAEWERIPQGHRLLNEKEVAEEIFPSLTKVAVPDTW